MPAPLAVLGMIVQGGALIGHGVDTLRKSTPQLEDEVTVEVLGQPGHDKQQLYFLALAAANGEVVRFTELNAISVTPTYGMLMIEFDQASNIVRVTMRYKVSLLAANGFVTNSVAPPRAGTFFDNLAVYRGPACEVVGDNFNFVSDTLLGFGIPRSSKSPDAPNGSADGSTGLPFVGQTILTMCPTTTPPVPKPIVQNPAPSANKVNNGTAIPSPNPKPPGDNRSRGAIVVPGMTTPSTPPSGGGTTPTSRCCPKNLALIPLVFAALSAPATDANMRFDSPIQGLPSNTIPNPG